jgi:hypothetical protein
MGISLRTFDSNPTSSRSLTHRYMRGHFNGRDIMRIFCWYFVSLGLRRGPDFPLQLHWDTRIRFELNASLAFRFVVPVRAVFLRVCAAVVCLCNKGSRLFLRHLALALPARSFPSADQDSDYDAKESGCAENNDDEDADPACYFVLGAAREVVWWHCDV